MCVSVSPLVVYDRSFANSNGVLGLRFIGVVRGLRNISAGPVFRWVPAVMAYTISFFHPQN